MNVLMKIIRNKGIDKVLILIFFNQRNDFYRSIKEEELNELYDDCRSLLIVIKKVYVIV